MTKLLSFPLPITTPRLLIRNPEIGDAVKINPGIIETLDKLKPLMPWAKQNHSITDSEDFVKQAATNWMLKNNEEPYLNFFLFEKNTHDFIGGVSFHHYNWDVPCLEIGYWVRDKYAGQGYIIEAVNALTRYAFIQLQMKRVEIRCDVANIRSKKIAESLGYHLEAILKSNRINHASNLVSDTLIYVRHDLQNLPELDVLWVTK